MAGAAFMQITNQSGQDDILTGAKTNVSAMTELHTHIDDGDGVIKMRQIVGGIKLAAGETIVMKRGGDHVMLMGLNDSLDTGETLEITLTFKEAGDVMVEVPVDNDR
jgi:copper(I)-binding protein